MSKSFARSGQRLAHRFDLIVQAAHQLPFEHASTWVARDTALSRQLRAVVIDPEAPQARDVIDAARRAALIEDPKMVGIVSVVEGDDFAVLTEVPPGTPLDQYLTGSPLNPQLVRSLMGEISSAVNTARHRGVRHLQLDAGDVYVSDAGHIVVDGFGIHAALAGVDINRMSSELDRDEARGLTVLLASLLLGRNFPEDPSTHDSVISEAAELPEISAELHDLLRREQHGEGAISPDDLMRRLVPWGDIDVNLLPATAPDIDAAEKFGPADSQVSENPTDETAAVVTDEDQAAPDTAVEDPAPSPQIGPTTEELSEISENTDEPLASSREEAARVVDQILDIDDDEGRVSALAWPGLSTVTPDEPLVAVEPESDGDDAAASDSISDADSDSELDSATEDSKDLESSDLESSDLETTVLPITAATADESKAGEAQAKTSAPRRVSFKDWRSGGDVDDQADSPTATRPVATSTAVGGSHKLGGSTAVGGSRAASKASTKSARPTWGSTTQVATSDEPRVNATWVSIILFTIIVLIAGYLGWQKLFSPFDEVTLQDVDPVQTEQPDGEGDGTDGNNGSEPTEDNPPVDTAADPVIASATLVSPEAGVIQGTNAATQDNPQSVPNAVDGNPATVWTSFQYVAQDMAPISGFGLYIELEEEAQVGAVTVNVDGTGGNIQWRDTVVEAPASGKLVAEGPMSAQTVLTAEEPVVTSSFVLWINELPVDNSSGTFQIKISEITVD